MNCNVSLLSSATCAFLLTASLASQSLAAPINGYKLKQKMLYYGQIAISATSKGTRIDAKELQLFIMPNQSARLYNTNNLRFCVLPKQIWMDKSGVQGHLSDIKKVNTGDYAGYRITQYVADMYDEKWRWWYQIEFSTTNQIVLPKDVIDDYLTLLGLPKGYGMPLSVVRHFDKNYAMPKHRKDIFLITYEAGKASIDPRILEPPAGFKQVKDEMEVVLNEGDLR